MFRHTGPKGCRVLHLWCAGCCECPHFILQNVLPANNSYWFRTVLFPSRLGIEHCICKVCSYATGSFNVMVLLLPVAMVMSLPPTNKAFQHKLPWTQNTKWGSLQCTALLTSNVALVHVCVCATLPSEASFTMLRLVQFHNALSIALSCLKSTCYHKQWNYLHCASTGVETQQHYLHFVKDVDTSSTSNTAKALWSICCSAYVAWCGRRVTAVMHRDSC